LEGATDEVPDHVAVTHDQCVALLLLIGIRAVEISPKGGLYARSVAQELLQGNEIRK